MNGKGQLVYKGRAMLDKPMKDLESAMREMPENLRAFSLSLRQLYAQYAVGTNEAAAVKFREIRDRTHTDAQLYMDVVIPLCKLLITKTDEFFDYCTELEPPLWKISVPTIKEGVQFAVEISTVIEQNHGRIMASLQDREHEVKLVMKDLEDLQETLKKKKHSLEKKSGRKQASAWKYVKSHNSEKAAEKFASSDLATAQAIAHGVQVQTQQEAITAVNNTLIPALKSFIGNLDQMISFFKVLGGQNLENLEVDKAQAVKVQQHCKRFRGCLPSVMTDLKAIPTEGTDQNYIDQWLERQTNMIKDNCTPKFAQSIIAILREQKSKALTSKSRTDNEDPPKAYRSTQV